MPLHNNVGVHGDGILTVCGTASVILPSVCVSVLMPPVCNTRICTRDWNTIISIRDDLIFSFKMHMEYHDMQHISDKAALPVG